MVMKDEQWDEVIAVNLTSTFMLCRAAARAMMRTKPGFGRIINIASISGVFGNPGQGNYAASKAGMIGMTKSLAREVGSRGITANCIAPGFIVTPMTEALNQKQTEEIAKMIPVTALRKARGDSRGGRLPRERGGGLRHGPDPAYQRRHGDDLGPMLANHPRLPADPSGAAFSGAFWRRRKALADAGQGQLKCVNEPNGFLAPGAYAYVRSGLMLGRCTRCEKLDTRVVSLPASREPVPIDSSDRTKGEPNSNELQIAKSN